MSMQHKAFRFDWESFNRNLREHLHDALLTGSATQLVMFINSAIGEFSDPYEGEPLTADWMFLLNDADDVHEVGDYALTRFYDPTEDAGIGDAWIAIDDSLNALQRNALLGRSIGPATNPFDPGKMGSYVQSPDDVAHSQSLIQGLNDGRLATFADLLDRCVSTGCGVYITF